MSVQESTIIGTGADRARDRRSGLMFAGVSALAFGSAGVAAKAAMTAAGPELTPMWLAQFRITGAALVLLLIVGVGHRLRPAVRRVAWTPRAIAAVIAYGVIGFVAIQVLYFVAISRMPVGVALLIEYTSPALVALWALLAQRRPQHRAVWLAIGAAMVGLVLIARPWQGFALDTVGVGAALLAAVASATYFLVGDALKGQIPGPQLAGFGAAAGAVVLGLTQSWSDFPWHLLGRRGELGGTAVPVWLLLAVVVVVGTVIAYLTGIAALRRLPAPIAAVVATMEVVVAAISAWMLLGEHLSAWELAGGALLLAGAVVAQRSPARPVEAPVPTAPLATAVPVSR
ncbi:EamA family transporter [Nakamurella deserti]|uniref:EamA family transporter n=1 Tax=Nakamurella deserti TaxID=2164074 RepID=UPI000DBE2EB6|nr:EamA family transporter [Nakamurella deserti]